MTEQWQSDYELQHLLVTVHGQIAEYRYAVLRQHARIYSDAEPLKEYSFKERAPAVEFHFLITGLWRIRSLLCVLESTGKCGRATQAIRDFDGLLPSLKDIRDTLEHYDERLRGRAPIGKIEWDAMRRWVFDAKAIWLNAGIDKSKVPSDGFMSRAPLCLSLDKIDQACSFAEEFAKSEMKRQGA